MTITLKSPYGQAKKEFIRKLYAEFDFPSSKNVTLFDVETTVHFQTQPLVTFVAKNCGVQGNSTNANSGAQSLAWQFEGKYYFEITWFLAPGGSSGGIAIGPVNTPYNDLAVVLPSSLCPSGVIANIAGVIYAGGVNMDTIIAPNGMQDGDVVGVAVDLDKGNVWFKVVGGPDANFDPDWNGGTAGSVGGAYTGSNPATNTLGIPIPLGSPQFPFGQISPFAIVDVSNSATQTMTLTANFGQAPYAIGNFNVPIFFNSWPPSSPL